MGEVLEDLQPLADDVVRLAALDVDDEADAAGVVLVPGVGQPRASGGPLWKAAEGSSAIANYSRPQHRSKIQTSYQIHD